MDEATKQAAVIDPVEVGDAHVCGEEGCRTWMPPAFCL